MLNQQNKNLLFTFGINSGGILASEVFVERKKKEREIKTLISVDLVKPPLVLRSVGKSF